MRATPTQITKQAFADDRRIRAYDTYWTKERTQSAWDAFRARNAEQPFASRREANNWLKEQYGDHGFEDAGNLKMLMAKYGITP